MPDNSLTSVEITEALEVCEKAIRQHITWNEADSIAATATRALLELKAAREEIDVFTESFGVNDLSEVRQLFDNVSNNYGTVAADLKAANEKIAFVEGVIKTLQDQLYATSAERDALKAQLAVAQSPVTTLKEK